MEMRAISKSTFEGIRISSLIVTTLFSILFISTDIIANVLFFLSKLQFFPSYDISFYGIVTLSCSVVLFLIKDTIGVIAAGILVLKTIRNVSNKIRNATNDSKSNNPFIVTILLLFGLLSCVFLQIFAACLSLGWENLKYAAQFINNIGILIFVILALVLFYPILNNKKRNTQITEITPTVTIPSSNKEQFFTKIQSENTPSSLSAQSPQTLEDLFKNSIV